MSSSTQEHIFQFSRVAGTITAGIFTGLALSFPVQSALLLSSASAASSPLIPHSSRVDQFEKLHKAASATAFPVAGLAGAFYVLAAWVRPGEVVLTTGARKAGVGITVVSDRLRQVTPLTLIIPPLLLLALPLLSYPMTRLTKAASSTASLSIAEKIAPPASASATGGNFATEQFEKDVKGWGVWLTTGAVMGCVAAAIGGAGLVGWGF